MIRYLYVIAVVSLIACKQEWKQDSGNASASAPDTLHQQEPVVDTSQIDFVQSSPDKVKILLENEHVRIIEYALQPGEMDSTHTHPPKASYVVSGGLLRIYPENGAPFDAEEVTGQAEWSDQVAKHHVQNIGTTTVRIVLTEVKSAASKP